MDQSRLLARAARRTAERARRKRTKAWESPIFAGEALGSNPAAARTKADAAFGRKLPSSFGPPFIDLLELRNSSDEGDGNSSSSSSASYNENRPPFGSTFKGPSTTAVKAPVDQQHGSLEQDAKRLPLKGTPAPRPNDKRRAQTPLSQRSPFESEENSTPRCFAKRCMNSSEMDGGGGIPILSMLSPADPDGGADCAFEHRRQNQSKPPNEDGACGDNLATSINESRHSSCSGVAIAKTDCGKAPEDPYGKPRKAAGTLKSVGGHMRSPTVRLRSNRTYGNFYSPTTFLRMRPYGAVYRVDRGTPKGSTSISSPKRGARQGHRHHRKSDAAKKSSSKGSTVGSSSSAAEQEKRVGNGSPTKFLYTTSGTESEWMPGAATDREETEEENRWETDGDSKDDAADEQSDDDTEGFGTDVSVKSGRWCQDVHEALGREGLSPKAPGVTGRRCGHLRYIQSYAEETLPGESELSEYVPTPDKQSDFDEDKDDDCERFGKKSSQATPTALSTAVSQRPRSKK
jgi:hypothetical protein